MQRIGILGCIFLAQTCVSFFATEAQRHSPGRDPMTSSEAAIFSEIASRDKRANKAEPTCDELRAMWIYSKRQSRAAETTNDLPMYRDPFAHNIWDTYPVRSSNPLGYRGTRDASIPQLCLVCCVFFFFLSFFIKIYVRHFKLITYF